VQHCRRMEKSPRRLTEPVGAGASPLAWGSETARPAPASAAAPKHLDVEVADLLAQGVAIDPEQVGGADLVAAGRRQGDRQQRMFDFPQDAVIEPWRGQMVAETGKIGRQMAFDRCG